jgi:HKD family nuclease
MATLEFILQGFTARTHLDALQRLFELPDIQRVLVSVAFVTQGGVERIEEQLIVHTSHTTVFAGIRNDTTTYQGLARLHSIVGQLHTVDTGSRTIMFHPKLYLVRGRERARLLVGSANLTLSGLNNNIEAGMLLDLDLASADYKELIDNIEMLFDSSVSEYPDHIVKVGCIADLDQLLAANRLVDEVKATRTQDTPDLTVTSEQGDDEHEIDGDNEGSGLPRIRLKVRTLQGSLRRPKGTSNLFKQREISKRPDVSEIPEVPQMAKVTLLRGPETTNEAISSFTPTDEANFDAETTPAIPINYYFPKKSRRGDGPRLRAARAKAEAIRFGKKWYYTGEPCIYGHYADRLVSNGKCRECNRLDCERSNRLGLYR